MRNRIFFARTIFTGTLLLCALALLNTGLSAADTSVPGRDPKQPIDEAYTQKILKYTTEPYFISPLVDYLPASKTVPTPEAVLGDIAGAPDILPYSSQVYQYMRMLAKASPRVKVFSIGQTEEGREMIAVAVASEANMAHLEANRARLAQLADPRTIHLDDAAADKIVDDSVPVYYITGTIHSTETGAPTALMELAYRLAVDDSPYIQEIRDHVITLITPVVEVDGRDRMVDLYRWHRAHLQENYPPLIYWGHYVAHDNNRDAMGMTLKLTQNVLDTFVGWKAQVLHDLHESVPYLYDNTVGDGPYNAWVDPILTERVGNDRLEQRAGDDQVRHARRFHARRIRHLVAGLSDVHCCTAQRHQPALRDIRQRRRRHGATHSRPGRILAHVVAPESAAAHGDMVAAQQQQLRRDRLADLSALLLRQPPDVSEELLPEGKRSIRKPETEGPAAYVLPADDPRSGAQAELLRILQKQGCEISRATAAFTVTVPVNKPKDHAHAASAQPEEKPAPETKTRNFPAGSYIVRMDQPYSRIADALLDYQYWSPNDPQKTPYDDTGWTFGELFNVQVTRVTDPAVLSVAMERVTQIAPASGISGTGTIFVINDNADTALATLRYQLKDAQIEAAEDAFEADGHKFNRGTFLIQGADSAALQKAVSDLGLQAYALSAAPSVKTHPVRAARVALLHTWLSTQTEGWWREALDFMQIPYDYISTQTVAKNADLNSKYDVILFPPVGRGVSPDLIINGLPTAWGNPLPWKTTELTPNIGKLDSTDDTRPELGWEGAAHLQDFVNHGGVLITVMDTANLAVALGLTHGVSIGRTQRERIIGSVVRTDVVDPASPIAYGYGDELSVYCFNGPAFDVSNVQGRGGFRRSVPKSTGAQRDAERPTIPISSSAARTKPLRSSRLFSRGRPNPSLLRRCTIMSG